MTCVAAIKSDDFRKWQQDVQNTIVGGDVDGMYPEVVISYATGNRERLDVTGAGPGTKYCYDITMALHAAGHPGIPCFSGLHVPAGKDWKMYFTKLDGRFARAKVFIVVLSKALFESMACLEEISRAVKCKTITTIIPVVFEAGLPGKSMQWSTIQSNDSVAVEKLDTVQATLGQLNSFPSPAAGLMRPELMPELVRLVLSAGVHPPEVTTCPAAWA